MTKIYKYDVFISHSTDDQDFAHHLAERLRRLDFHVWGGRKAKNQVSKQIATAMEESAVCVLLFGPSGKSPWPDEYVWSAISNRIERTYGRFRVIPILLPRLVSADREMVAVWKQPWASRRQTGTFIRFENDMLDDEAIHQLVLKIRGADRVEESTWNNSYFRESIRQRARNALNVDWAKLITSSIASQYRSSLAEQVAVQELGLKQCDSLPEHLKHEGNSIAARCRWEENSQERIGYYSLIRNNSVSTLSPRSGATEQSGPKDRVQPEVKYDSIGSGPDGSSYEVCRRITRNIFADTQQITDCGPRIFVIDNCSAIHGRPATCPDWEAMVEATTVEVRANWNNPILQYSLRTSGCSVFTDFARNCFPPFEEGSFVEHGSDSRMFLWLTHCDDDHIGDDGAFYGAGFRSRSKRTENGQYYGNEFLSVGCVGNYGGLPKTLVRIPGQEETVIRMEIDNLLAAQSDQDRNVREIRTNTDKGTVITRTRTLTSSLTPQHRKPIYSMVMLWGGHMYIFVDDLTNITLSNEAEAASFSESLRQAKNRMVEEYEKSYIKALLPHKTMNLRPFAFMDLTGRACMCTAYVRDFAFPKSGCNENREISKVTKPDTEGQTFDLLKMLTMSFSQTDGFGQQRRGE